MICRPYNNLTRQSLRNGVRAGDKVCRPYVIRIPGDLGGAAGDMVCRPYNNLTRLAPPAAQLQASAPRKGMQSPGT